MDLSEKTLAELEAEVARRRKRTPRRRVVADEGHVQTLQDFRSIVFDLVAASERAELPPAVAAIVETARGVIRRHAAQIDAGHDLFEDHEPAK